MTSRTEQEVRVGAIDGRQVLYVEIGDMTDEEAWKVLNEIRQQIKDRQGKADSVYV